MIFTTKEEQKAYVEREMQMENDNVRPYLLKSHVIRYGSKSKQSIMNQLKQRFLKKIAENNSGVSWFHFGDIDPDGYYILKNLVEKTGIAFVPLYMDVQQLINCKQYCKPLEKNDIVKANSLLKFHFYDEVMEFMLANNCKLEQEIISWLYERN